MDQPVTKTRKARCPECRSEVEIPESYAHGEQLNCRSCRAGVRVYDRGGLRLVLADLGPVRDTIAATQRRVHALEVDLRAVRGSFGVGVNGIGIGLIWAVYQVALKEHLLDKSLLTEVVAIALGTGILLEVANHFLLAKRQKMLRIAADIEDAKAEIRNLQKKLRDSTVRF